MGDTVRSIAREIVGELAPGDDLGDAAQRFAGLVFQQVLGLRDLEVLVAEARNFAKIWTFESVSHRDELEAACVRLSEMADEVLKAPSTPLATGIATAELSDAERVAREQAERELKATDAAVSAVKVNPWLIGVGIGYRF